jgi:hypothetical protein
MNGIYQVTVRGRKLESRDLRKLLARAVAEKRSMDQRLRLFASLHRDALSGSGTVSGNLCIGDAASH